MNDSSELTKDNHLDVMSRIIHFGLMAMGIMAWLSGYWAGDYKHLHHPGFSLHSYLGMGLAFCMTLHLIYGFFGPDEARFHQWVPYTKSRLLLVWGDIINLLKVKLPERPSRQGLAGVVECLGLLIFGWMTLTGTLIFLYLQPGGKAKGMLHLIKEGHEIGAALIPVFLVIHVGAVILHALFGQHLWRKAFFLDR